MDMAVVRWGTALDAALADATSEAKTKAEAESRANGIMRRWVPALRKYR